MSTIGKGLFVTFAGDRAAVRILRLPWSRVLRRTMRMYIVETTFHSFIILLYTRAATPRADMRVCVCQAPPSCALLKAIGDTGWTNTFSAMPWSLAPSCRAQHGPLQRPDWGRDPACGMPELLANKLSQPSCMQGPSTTFPISPFAAACRSEPACLAPRRWRVCCLAGCGRTCVFSRRIQRSGWRQQCARQARP